MSGARSSAGRGGGVLHLLLLAALPGLLLGGLRPVSALAEEPPPGTVPVPDVRRLPPEQAARRLVAAGLNPGRVFEVAVPAGWRLGLVVQQAPAPAQADRPRYLPRGDSVALAVSASRDGPKEGAPAPASWPRVPHAPPAAPPTVPAPGPAPAGSAGPRAPAVRPTSSASEPPPAPRPRDAFALPVGVPGAAAPPRPAIGPSVLVGPPAVPPPSPPANGPLAPPAVSPAAPPAVPAAVPAAVPPAAPSAEAPRASRPPGPSAQAPPPPVGSPDAPPLAPPPDPAATPALLGLSLADADERARLQGLSLDVERVAGLPVGRVLSQDPPPGSPAPAGGWMKVVVAAGGDLPGPVAPAPSVRVAALLVPDLLDRTAPQARRILEDLGFVPRVESALHGPAGRVVDQQPAAGTALPKGGEVVVRVAPGSLPEGAPASAPRPGTAPVPPAGAGPAAPPAARTAPDAPDGAPAPAPVPVSPAAGTSVGGGTSLSLALMWREVGGADAYVVEVEECGPDGWLPSARQVVRRTAAVVEVERVADPPGALRWRVGAVRDGRPGPRSGWVELR